jgi:DNA primase
MPQINPKPIYGLDYIKSNEVIVCESVINALTCFSYGREAIALFGTGSASQADILKNSNIRHFILALDPDTAGISGTNRLVKALDNKLVSILPVPKGKDINDLTREEFYSCLENLQIA